MKKIGPALVLLSFFSLSAFAADADTVQRSMAANEKLMQRFENEKNNLPQDSAQAQKLDEKIKRLKLENESLSKKLAVKPTTQRLKSPSKLTGKDWFALSGEEKINFIRLVAKNLGEDGVIVTKPFSFYVEEMDRVIQMEPRFEPELLSGIFVFCVHRNEPELHSALEKLRT